MNYTQLGYLKSPGRMGGGAEGRVRSGSSLGGSEEDVVVGNYLWLDLVYGRWPISRRATSLDSNPVETCASP